MMLQASNSSTRHQQEHGNANVQVVVRVRPLNEAENDEKYHTVTEAISDHMLVFDPKVQSAPGFLPTNQRDINRRRFKDLKYAFDFVFGPLATNKDVFEHTTKKIVNGVLNGYNCSVFAYGATGAGKTHTMLGNEREPGVIYYTMIDLYRRINELKDEKMFDVAVSYSEVYNEQVRDLLMPRGNLPIREDKTVGVIIAGLSLHKPKTADELLHMLHFGNKNRTQHPTDANAESSRSHAVFQVFVNQREKSANVSTEVKMAKMCLVDLAGSERAHHTTNRGERFREGANINRSLLALGNVINALADNKFKGHIPYRDSKLTRLLKDSLGGNCQTVMIAAVSPSSRSFEDTYNTLRYADRAKHIRADLKKNIRNVDFHIVNYKKYVQELEKENQELRREKRRLEESLDKPQMVTSPIISPIIRQFQERLKDLFKARRDTRKTQMESEGAKRELKWKVARKEQAIKRVQQLTGAMTVIGKHKRVIERMKRRIVKEEQALRDSAHRIQEQDSSIYDTFSKIITTQAESKQFAELLDLNTRIHTVEANLYDSHMYLAFVKKMARAQERQASVNEKLISSLIQLVKKQHDILHSQDLLNNELTSKYEQCCYLVEERGVAWTSPKAAQDTMAPTRDEEEEMCISDIIDIQMPKLHMQALQTSGTVGQDSQPHTLQQPQRVSKPTSAVKPASRVCAGQMGISINQDKPPQHSMSPQNFSRKSDEGEINLPTLPDISQEDVSIKLPPVAVKNTVEMLNASFDMCPKRRGLTPKRTAQTCSTAAPTTGISFDSNEGAGSRGDEIVNSTKPQIDTDGNQNTNLFPSSSLPNIEDSSSLVRRSLWSNTTHLDLKNTNSSYKPLPQAKPPPAEDENSSTDHLNQTFKVSRPSLPNTPSIDTTRRQVHHGKDSGIVQPRSLQSHVRNSPFHNRAKQTSWDRPVYSQRLDNSADGPTHRYSPGPKFHDRPSGASWTSSMRGNDREDRPSNSRPQSLESPFRHSFYKTKTPVSPAINRHSTNSPVLLNKASPSPVSSSRNAGSSIRSINSGGSRGHNSSHIDKSDHYDRQRSDSVSCVNANNVNTGSTGATSPKSYADVVKSPVVSRVQVGVAFKISKPAVDTSVSNVAAIMKTPDFGKVPGMTSALQNLENSLSVCPGKKFSDSNSGSGDEGRQPLRTLQCNTPILRPQRKSKSSIPECSSSSSSDSGSGTIRSQLKVRTDHASHRRHKRALAHEPYNILQRRQRIRSTQELPTEPNMNGPHNGASRPSYMQPTFARAQKMLGLGRERLVQREVNNPLSRRTLTHKLTSSWNRSSSLTETSWKL